MTVFIELEAYKHYDAHRDHFWRSGKSVYLLVNNRHDPIS